MLDEKNETLPFTVQEATTILEPSSVEAQIGLLQKQVDDLTAEVRNVTLQKDIDELTEKLKDTERSYSAQSRFLGEVIAWVIIGLILNFTLVPPEWRPIMPKVPKPRFGSTCQLWYNHSENGCALWNTHTERHKPMDPDTGGFEDACKAAGRMLEFKGAGEGPLPHLGVSTWVCAE